MKKVKTAVIPVAGFGTRFLPFTKAVPKPMLPILNIPAIEIIAKEAIDSGIEKIVFVVGHRKEIIEEHFKACPQLEEVLRRGNKKDFLEAVKLPETFNVSFVEQKRQSGSADAVLAAREYVDGEPFAVLFGDDVIYNDGRPVIGQLMDEYERMGKTVIGVKRVPHKDVPKYASVEYDSFAGRSFSVTRITEKPLIEKVKSDLAPLGRYVLAPTIFPILERLEPSVNGEYQLTDALDRDARKNGAYAYEFEGIRYDMGDRLGFLKANIEFGLRDEKLKDDFKAYLKSLSETL